MAIVWLLNTCYFQSYLERIPSSTNAALPVSDNSYCYGRYSRQGTIPLGKLSLNLQAYPGVVSSPIIGNVTEPSEAAKTIHHALSKICTTVVLHALSVHNLCNLSYVSTILVLEERDYAVLNILVSEKELQY